MLAIFFYKTLLEQCRFLAPSVAHSSVVLTVVSVRFAVLARPVAMLPGGARTRLVLRAAALRSAPAAAVAAVKINAVRRNHIHSN